MQNIRVSFPHGHLESGHAVVRARLVLSIVNLQLQGWLFSHILKGLLPCEYCKMEQLVSWCSPAIM